MSWAAILTAAFLALVPLAVSAQGQVLWQGGLWNLDYPDAETSKYGEFRLIIEPDLAQSGAQVLRIEWIENIDGKGQRLFASRLIPELDAFVSAGAVTAQMGELPTAVRLQNGKGRTLWLRLGEPARYRIQRTLK